MSTARMPESALASFSFIEVVCFFPDDLFHTLNN
jgi:hypothetical protein